ncbi:hypothetical protein BLAT2472_50301 [Burkholderia latens]
MRNRPRFAHFRAHRSRRWRRPGIALTPVWLCRQFCFTGVTAVIEQKIPLHFVT